jgi:hypothetical protein
LNNNIIKEKPCVVAAKQGFSVSYNNRFLYSQYNPSKLIIEKINSLNNLPGTIFLCNSAILEYGILELYNKLPENCLMFLCEFDSNLYQLMKDSYNKLLEKNKLSNVAILTPQELYSLPSIIHKTNYTFENGFVFTSLGFYKRFVRIDFSAGTFFNQQLYNSLEEACVNSVKTFWANRVTLVKFGRKYSYNLFKKLQKIDKTVPIENFFYQIEKPIIVFGAGQTLEKDIKIISQNANKFCILCADTALQPLLKYNVVPDGVFLEEAQNVIKQAFLGTLKYNFHLFAGLSSIPELSEYIDIKKISYFTSLYTNANFLNNLQQNKLLPFANMPFGSVGITTMYYATKFRKNKNVPIYYYGLDFSYSAGFTHTKNTIAHILRLSKSNKINQVQNYNAAFSNVAIKLSKDNSCFSTPVLLGYKNLFDNLFSLEPNIIQNNVVIPENANEYDLQFNLFTKENSDKTLRYANYFETQKNQLVRIKNLLTGAEKFEMPEQAEQMLTQLITSCDYLYLHFPDGWQFLYTQSFLNRVRVEVDFFLKLYNL